MMDSETVTSLVVATQAAANLDLVVTMAAKKPSTNPFADSFDSEDASPEEVDEFPPKPASDGKIDSSNPFDFDVDFGKVQARRERARAAKQEAKPEAEKPILQYVDAEDEPTKPIGPRRPNIVTRAMTTTTAELAVASQQHKRKATGFFGFKKDAPLPDFTETPATDLHADIRVGNLRLAVWPYDDYHLVQKVYYERLQELTSDEKKEVEAQPQSVPIFARPADPPDIPTAVEGLSLNEFEHKAEERSIAIVSTWLFDAGLIDELLVNGGMTAWSLRRLDDDKSVQSTPSVPSQEGIEVGQLGQPIEGSTKFDKEISKLRNSTNRQLALINARLNDGVAATGSEVQELVNAVIATKDDIGRLRELSTYVSNAADVDQANQFMLTKYPKLKQAINARRNLARCFRELDFFAQIPSTCDRLREELQSCEWTAHEWSTLRSVCREHVELEIFLVEAEAGMKKRLEEDEETGRKKDQRKKKNKYGRQAFVGAGSTSDKADLIDKFLHEHVENVWELGDEIRMRIMSGIGTAFDLAMNNPAGMVALVEAVEVYQSANDDYKAVHGEEAGRSQNLRFTDMRAAALGELYKDFETRGLDVFRELTMQAADIAEEDEAANRQFSAVLRAANELTSEIGVVREQMVPCFPPNWQIEVLWTTCVAHVCSNNILQQIGGPEGHKLPDLIVTQLLDLVAWVENFREIIEESFPNIGSITSKRTYLDKPPKLLQADNKTVDVEVAKDSLAWVNNVLWDVHDLAKDEFLFRTKEQTEEWLVNVYKYVLVLPLTAWLEKDAPYPDSPLQCRPYQE